MRGTLWDINEAIHGNSSCRWCSCWRAESFIKTVKWEEVYLHEYQSFEEAQARLQTFLENVYNAKRLHSSLDYVPPDEFELKYAMC